MEWVYPPSCLSCKEPLEKGSLLFCPSCLDHIALIDPSSCCTRCFAKLTSESAPCSLCASHPLPLQRHAAVCERLGPALSLIPSLEKGYLFLAKTIASLIVLQHSRLNLHLPDQIIPLPTHLFTKGSIRSSLSFWVAKEVGNLFGKPTSSYLKKKIDIALEKGGFTKLSSSFKPQELKDKRLLLVSLYADREALSQASFLLWEGLPRRIDSLSFFP